MNAWVKRKNAPDGVISVIPDITCTDAALTYNLYVAFEGAYLGRILFDD